MAVESCGVSSCRITANEAIEAELDLNWNAPATLVQEAPCLCAAGGDRHAASISDDLLSIAVELDFVKALRWQATVSDP